MRAWADEYELEGEEREELFFLLAHLDVEYLKWEDRQRGGKSR